MQHQVSHPLTASHSQTARRARPIVVTMPNARDERYPRSLVMRVVRAVAGIWWMPFVSIAGYAAMTSMLLAANASAGPTLDALAASLGLGELVPTLQGQPLLLLIPALMVPALVVGMVASVRWAADDRMREARTLLLREVSPQEQANPTWMRNAFAPALDWRVRCLLRRRMLTALLLTAAAVVMGALIALLVAGTHLSLAAVLPH